MSTYPPHLSSRDWLIPSSDTGSRARPTLSPHSETTLLPPSQPLPLPRSTDLGHLPHLPLPTIAPKMLSPLSALLPVPLPTLPNLLSLPGHPNHLPSKLPRARSPLPVVSDEPVPRLPLRTHSPILSVSHLGISKLERRTKISSRKSKNLPEPPSRVVLRCLLD